MDPSAARPDGRTYHTAGDVATQELARRLAATPWRPASTPPDVHVGSRPETVVWGHVPTGGQRVATVAPGTLVRVDTVSHQGMTTADEPRRFFARHGIAPGRVLADVVDIHASVARPAGADSHVLTGPIEVRGARAGDALEVRIHAADLRVAYGINHSGPGIGVLPELLAAPVTRLLRVDPATDELDLGADIRLPVRPFPGVVAVQPPPTADMVGSRKPGRWGGNLDIRSLTAGARLVLPVFQDGAGVFVGDPHAVQGAGEVNGTAVEHSSSYTLEFIVHEGLAPRWPLVSTASHVTAIGIDDDLATALAVAVSGLVDVAVGLGDGRLDEVGAYTLCSLAAELEVAEAVNVASVVCASLPRHLFPPS